MLHYQHKFVFENFDEVSIMVNKTHVTILVIRYFGKINKLGFIAANPLN